jgi:hypothetical protein
MALEVQSYQRAVQIVTYVLVPLSYIFKYNKHYVKYILIGLYFHCIRNASNVMEITLRLLTCWICGSLGSDYDEYCFLGCDTG